MISTLHRGVAATCLLLSFLLPLAAAGATAAETAVRSTLPAIPANPITPAAAAPPLSGSAAWAKLVGNSIGGITPDGPYREFFSSDGGVVHLDRDGPVAGRWRLAESQVCFTYPDEDEDCRGVEVETDAKHGAFLDSDGTRYPFEILPGRADGL